MYKPGAFPELISRENWHASWVEWFIKESESAHAKCRRWDAPDEYPFTPREMLPPAILPPVKYPHLLYDHGINVNRRIYEHYRDVVVPSITGVAADDDGQYGSAACRDVELLSALSRRIHFGMFVSESKFRSDPKAFLEPIRNEDKDTLLALITKPQVEAALLVRLRQKAEVYGQDLNNAVAALKSGAGGGGAGGSTSGSTSGSAAHEHEHHSKIEADEVVKLYESFVIPLTKVVEVDYLLKR